MIMDYEKKYKEALEWARKVMQGKVGFVLDEVLEKFPELKESEDEKNIKNLIDELKCSLRAANCQNDACGGGHEKRIALLEWSIDWLEKQAEQNPVGKIQLGKKYKCIASPRYSTFMKGKIYKPEDKFLCSLMNFCSDCFEPIEDVEQKPIVPKFKVGDWVVCNNGPHHIFQVIERSWPNAKYRNIDGAEIFLNVNTLDKQYHLWTIKDAKNGDVLVCGERKRPFIFKGLIDKSHPESPVAYCGIDTLDNFIIASGRSWWTDEEVYPATMEQRKLLFQKMEEAGWEWDAYKKELKLLENQF